MRIDSGDAPEARLDEFDRDEWREVARKLRPDLTDEEFDSSWAEFQEAKRRKSLQ